MTKKKSKKKGFIIAPIWLDKLNIYESFFMAAEREGYYSNRVTAGLFGIAPERLVGIRSINKEKQKAGVEILGPKHYTPINIRRPIYRIADVMRYIPEFLEKYGGVSFEDRNRIKANCISKVSGKLWEAPPPPLNKNKTNYQKTYWCTRKHLAKIQPEHLEWLDNMRHNDEERKTNALDIAAGNSLTEEQVLEVLADLKVNSPTWLARKGKIFYYYPAVFKAISWKKRKERTREKQIIEYRQNHGRPVELNDTW